MDEFSSSSSSEEKESQDDVSGKMQNLADLMWNKIKKDSRNKTCSRTESRETERVIPADSLHIQTVTSNLRLKNLLPDAKVEGHREAKAEGTSLTSARMSFAQEALKAASTKVVSVESKRQQKKQAKLEKSQWQWKKGSWGAVKKKDQTEEEKRDLMILSMRSTIDPVQHYKKTDLKAPKFFQVGTVVDNAADFYDRVHKKKRKRTLLDELMADDNFRKQTKKRYMEVVAAKASRKGLYQGKAPRKSKKKK